jgi:hypothetical protein
MVSQGGDGMNDENVPFKCFVDARGYYTDEYKEWATKAENYPGSSLQIEDVGCDARIKKFKDDYLVETPPTASRDASYGVADSLRQFGGLSKVTTCMRNKQKRYIVWFNPNGSESARNWALKWCD